MRQWQSDEPPHKRRDTHTQTHTQADEQAQTDAWRAALADCAAPGKVNRQSMWVYLFAAAACGATSQPADWLTADWRVVSLLSLVVSLVTTTSGRPTL